MSKKHQKEVERTLIDLVNNHNNENKCGECGSTYPTWASYSLGMFLCGRCASFHRRILGPPVNISYVQSLTLDNWSNSQLDRLRKIGNKKAKRKWNPKRVPFPYDGDDDSTAIEQYIRDKYILGKFRDDDIDVDDYGNGSHFSRSRLNSARLNSARSRLNSLFERQSTNSVKELPKLTHRKVTTYESTQYPSQANQIRGLGYTNTDTIIESLLLSNGNVEIALDILELDSKINPNENEIAPALPRRRPAKPAEPKLAEEWWSGQPQITGQSQTAAQVSQIPQITGQPQIYQYTDPITGQVSYIDANGQQYLDPNNPQHQQQLMQQTNPQFLQQQMTKQNILSLYGQQNSYMTNVAVPVNQQQAVNVTGAPTGVQAAGTQPGSINPQATAGLSMQSQQLLQQQALMNQPTSNGFGPQASGFQPQFQAGGYAQPNQFTGFGQQQWR